MVIMAIILGFVIGELCHLYDHVHDIFAFLLDKLPFHMEGNQEEYMHLYLLVVLMFSMSGKNVVKHQIVISYFQLPISYIYPPTFYAVSDKFIIFVPLKTTKR